MVLLPVQYVQSRTCFVGLPLNLINSILMSENLITYVNLKVVTPDGATSFVTWTGDRSAVDALEVPQALAECLQLPNNAQVDVTLVPEVPAAQQVEVDPCGIDDWEILESQPGYVEEQLLNQVRVVSKGQIIPVWIHNQTLVRLRVSASAPTQVVCLVPDSEVVVAPKPRYQNVSSTAKHAVRIQAPPESSATTVCSHSPSNGSFAYQPLTVHIAESTIQAWDDDVNFVSGDIVFVECTRTMNFDNIMATEQKAADRPNGTVDTTTTPTKSQAYARLCVHGDDDGDSPSAIALNHIYIGQTLRYHLGVTVNALVTITPAMNHTPTPYSRVTLRNISYSEDGESSVESLDRDKVMNKFHEWALSASNGSRNVIQTTGQMIICLSPDMDENNLEDHYLLSVTSQTTEQQANVQTDDLFNLDPRVLQTITQFLGSIRRTRPHDTWEQAPSLNHVGGVDSCLEQLQNHIDAYTHYGGLRQQLGLQGVGRAVIHGSHGSGKTFLSHATMRYFASSQQRYYCTVIPCAKLRIETMGQVRRVVSAVFKDAVKNAPSVVFLDDIDLLAPSDSEEASQTEESKTLQFVHYFTSLMESEDVSEASLAVVCCAQTSTSLHKRLTVSHLFSEAIKIPTADMAARQQIVKRTLEARNCNFVAVDISAVGSMTEGYVAADLCTYCERAIMHAARRPEQQEGIVHILQEDFEQAKVGFVPSYMAGVSLQKPDVSWKDIGGLEEVKRVLKETLLLPTKYSVLLDACPIRIRSGFLLYGPPGCGKTLMARGVAGECNLNLISVKGPELLNKYIGASEQAVRDVFVKASAAKPCILLFDEFDSIAPRRGHDNTGVTDRVVNQFLTQLDGVEPLEGVYVIATTSRPDLIDPALLRPGRLDKSMLCGFPTQTERKHILQQLAASMTIDQGVDFAEVAAQTENYSGADLQALLYSAQLSAVHSQLDTSNVSQGKATNVEASLAVVTVSSSAGPTNDSEFKKKFSGLTTEASMGSEKLTKQHRVVVDQQAILAALESSQPSISANEKRRLQKLYATFSGEGETAPSEINANKRVTLA
eukprot:GFYU01007645.1.p1 GENE.GFYU01007645.1~~GFYU01007645.1.p1  ORF type:complete len:1055 (+),score=89.22 GFYU01007645.1:48-3212(+)